MAATAEKAQHEPQPPWFFTPVTAPFYLQSRESGALELLERMKVLVLLAVDGL